MRIPFSPGQSRPFRLLAALLPALALAGCAALAPRSAPPPAVMRTASMDELLGRLAPGGAGVRTMKASYSASYADPARGAARSVSGMLAAGEGGNLRMKGSAAMLPTLFDLLVVGGEASVYVPRDRAVYRSSAGRPSRRGIADAALLTGVFLGSEEGPGTLHVVEEERARYLVSSVEHAGGRATLVRRVAFDRADLSPVLYQYFDAAGRVAREIRCAGFAPAEGASAPIPREVTIEAPQEGARIVVRLSGLRVNPALPPGMFSLGTPPGTAVRPIEECAP